VTETILRGPGCNAGAVLDGRVEPNDGPGLEYQATGFPDVRFPNLNTTGMSPGRVRGWLNSPFIVACDNIPQANSATVLAAATTIVAGTPIPLLTAGQANGTTAGNPTMMPGTSIYRADTGALVSGLAALDFGFTTGTTVVGNNNMTVNDGTLFVPGQWIAVGGAGNAAKTVPLYTQVMAVAANVVTLRDAPAAAVTNAPIGSAVPPVPYGAASRGIFPQAVAPFMTGGIQNFLNPPEALARGIVLTAVAGTAAQAVPVRGYDVYGFPMTEIFNLTGGAQTLYGKKAFKYLASVTPVTVGGTLAVGISDVFGIHVRSDKWEYTNLFYSGAFLTTSAGWLAGDKTNPATNASGDVRGTLQVSAAGGGTPIAAPAATNGTTNRLMIATTVPLFNNLSGTPVNPTSMYGSTQYAG
jgi:hypothetical protein